MGSQGRAKGFCWTLVHILIVAGREMNPSVGFADAAQSGAIPKSWRTVKHYECIEK